MSAALLSFTASGAAAITQLPHVELGKEQIDFAAPVQVEALLDKSQLLTFEDVTAPAWRERFRPRADKGLNFGITQDAVWLHFSLYNPGPTTEWLLLIDNPGLEKTELFVRASDGNVLQMQSGESIFSEVQPLAGREVAFPLTVPTGEHREIYARIVSAAPLTAPLQLLTPKQYQQETRISAILLSGIAGGMFLLIIIATVNLRRHRRSLHMWAYIAMVLVQTIFILTQDGLSKEYLFPNHPDLTTAVKTFLISLLAPVALFYTMLTLDFRQYAPKIWPLGLALVILGIAGTFISLLLPAQFINTGASLLSGIIAALLLGAIPYVWLRGIQVARPFFLTGLPLILSGFLVVAHNLAWFPLQTSFVMHTYKLAYLLFLAFQLYQTLEYLRQKQSNSLSDSQRMRVWREMSSLLDNTSASPNETAQIFKDESAQPYGKPVVINTLGRFEVRLDNKPVRFANRGVPRHQLLLTLVLAGGTRGINRATAVDNLWPDSDGDMADKSFRTTLYRLRQTIGADALQQSGAFLKLNPETIWVDDAIFEKIAANLAQAKPDVLDPQSVTQALLALELYKGDLLPGFDSPQITARRTYLRGLFNNLVTQLAEHYITDNDYHHAIQIYQLGLSQISPSELHCQGMLRCHLALKQFPEGIAAFEHCREFMFKHFNRSPSAETERLKLALSEQQANHETGS